MCAQTSSNIEALDSAPSDSADDQLNSSDNAVQSTTEGLVASSEEVLANPACDETKPEELSPTIDSLLSSSDIANKEYRTEEQSCTTENLEEGAESSEVRTTDNKEISPDSTVVKVDGDVSSDDKDKPSSGNEPSTSEADDAKRLSKAMIDFRSEGDKFFVPICLKNNKKKRERQCSPAARKDPKVFSYANFKSFRETY